MCSAAVTVIVGSDQDGRAQPGEGGWGATTCRCQHARENLVSAGKRRSQKAFEKGSEVARVV